jgi:hypothetical protein
MGTNRQAPRRDKMSPVDRYIAGTRRRAYMTCGRNTVLYLGTL